MNDNGTTTTPATILDASPISAVPQTALSTTDGARAVAEVQAAMVVARMNPRDPIAATDRIKNACARPTLAETALYSYSRGGTAITGPSIRLAEAIAQQWGNMQFGIREISQRNGESIVQAFAWDVETNTRTEKTFTVKHWRDTRGGGYKVEGSRDVYELVANQGARRLRACILAVVPGDVVEMAVEACEDTLRSSADTSPEAVQKLVSAFGDLGVTKQQIEKRIQRRLDTIQPAQIIQLRKVYASLRDGMSTASDWFEPDEAEATEGKGNEGAKDAIKKKSKGGE